MKKVSLNGLKLSRIVHGYWRLAEWKMPSQEVLNLMQQTIDLGITSFDHADIYGNYTCEKLFGDALRLKKELRKDIQLITKCGIKLVSEKFPDRKIKYYDYSSAHIVDSVNTSLTNFGTDYIDLLLLHRPSPFFNAEEVATAFAELRKSGKVLHFGVSNFNPHQYALLNSFVDEPLVTNQIELSPYCLDNFENGNMDFLQTQAIKPMAWSPLAGGKIMNPKDEKGKRVQECLTSIASELNVDSIDKIIYCWLLKHPASIIPIVGSGKIERIKHAVDALSIEMSLEQWFKLFIAAKGEDLP